jgi:hypothetical protein
VKQNTEVKIDYKQKQQLRDRKGRRQEKSYKQCQECLYILSNCVLCEDGNEVFDRENVLHHAISDTIIEKSNNSIRDNRVATQERDSCNFNQ